MDIFINNKTFFNEESWVVRTYYIVRSWLRRTFNKKHMRLVWKAYTGMAHDESFLYEIERAKIEEMLEFQERHQKYVDCEYVIRDMKICLSLMDIFMGKKDVFHFDGGFEVGEPNENGLSKVTESNDFKYNCDVYVNTRNADRFVKYEKARKYYLEYPHEIYILKAKRLYHKIRYERDETWWE